MDKNWDSSDSDGETEDKRGINSGHVIVVGTNAAGDLMIHLTMRSSRIPASHAGGAWNHAAGSADRGEHPDVAAAREFLEEYGHELSSMPNEKLADGVFVVYAGPEFAVDPNATHAYEIERRHGRAVEKWWHLERLYDALTMPSRGRGGTGFEHKYNMTKVNAKPRKLALFTYRVIVEYGIEFLRFAAFPPKRQEDWYLRPTESDGVELMEVTPSLPAYLVVGAKAYVHTRSGLFDPATYASRARAGKTLAARIVRRHDDSATLDVRLTSNDELLEGVDARDVSIFKPPLRDADNEFPTPPDVVAGDPADLRKEYGAYLIPHKLALKAVVRRFGSSAQAAVEALTWGGLAHLTLVSFKAGEKGKLRRACRNARAIASGVLGGAAFELKQWKLVRNDEGLGLWAPRGTTKSLAALEVVLETLRSAGAHNVRTLADLHLTIRGDGYDVAAFLAAIKKWQLVVVEKDPGRSLAAQQSLVIDQRYNMK